jgi:hypothetical protein
VLFFQPGQNNANFMSLEVRELAVILVSVAATALCWGTYGPILHKGQMKMGGSRLRPFICVGLAYFAIAVVVPVALLTTWHEAGRWDLDGTFWSLAAGAAGALGALGIILAFNFGGKPILVMPLVFGGAPVVNTLMTIATRGAYDSISPLFYGSLVLVIVGAVLALVFAPRHGPKDVHHQPAAHEPEASRDTRPAFLKNEP